MQDIEIETIPRENILHELTHGEPYLPITAIRLGDKWYSFLHEITSWRSFVAFHSLGLWTNDHTIRKWPTNHPDDVAKLTSLIFAAIVEGEL
jgi:hypothetical protein